jgi:glycosyltransferase involved in cell wall biosynthesis
VNPRLRDDADPLIFRSKYRLDKFVLCVGRIEWSKNQLLLAIACQKLGLPLVLIGSCMQSEYAKLCREHGPDQLLILDHMPQIQLASAYAAALVHALPSWIETCGLSTMEALSLGCPAVASIVGHEFEHFGGMAQYCDPASVDSIQQAVQVAIQSEAFTRRAPMTFKNWQNVASALRCFYEDVLAERPGVAPSNSWRRLQHLGAMVQA